MRAIVIATVVGPQLPYDPDRLREAVRDLLSQPPFTEHAPGILERAVERGLDAVGASIVRLLAAAGGDSAIAWTIVALGIMLLSVAAWRIVRGMATDRSVTGAVIDPQSHAGDGPTPDGPVGGGAAAVLRAEYRRLLTALDDRGLLQRPHSLTPREIVRHLAVNQPRVVDAVAPAARALEEVSYAGREASDDDVAVVTAATRALTVRGT